MEKPNYKESAVTKTKETGLMVIDAYTLSLLGVDTFAGKGQNQKQLQKDFRALF